MSTKKEQIQQEIDNKEEKLTTSKKLLVVAWGLLIALIILDIFGAEVETSLEMVGGLVTAIVSSVYMFKARMENKCKITYSMLDQLADKYGIENVIELVRDVIND